MARPNVEAGSFKGTCHFCQQEFAKNKMTQHLKSCPARKKDLQEQEGTPERILHILVEGQYRPAYWMHLEIPAEATLGHLDGFLRDVWVECCGHLSEFTINDTTYSSDAEGPWDGGFALPEAGDDLVDEEAEDENLPSISVTATEISERIASEFDTTDLKTIPVEQIEDKLMQLFAESLPPGLSPTMLPGMKPLVNFMAEALQQGNLAEEMESMVEEAEEQGDEMDAQLGDVLNVGDKFSYVYDFGSSTNLSLRVIAEREGVMPLHLDDDLEEEHETEELSGDELDLTAANDEDEALDEEDLEDEEDEDEFPIAIIARNDPPELVCQVCGKPATQVISQEEFASLDKAGYCDDCARKVEDEDLLPVVNSPRVGVCGYTGEVDGEDDGWYEVELETDEEDDEEE